MKKILIFIILLGLVSVSWARSKIYFIDQDNTIKPEYKPCIGKTTLHEVSDPDNIYYKLVLKKETNWKVYLNKKKHKIELYEPILEKKINDRDPTTEHPFKTLSCGLFSAGKWRNIKIKPSPRKQYEKEECYSFLSLMTHEAIFKIHKIGDHHVSKLRFYYPIGPFKAIPIKWVLKEIKEVQGRKALILEGLGKKNKKKASAEYNEKAVFDLDTLIVISRNYTLKITDGTKELVNAKGKISTIFEEAPK